jgi:hypothetical protein
MIERITGMPPVGIVSVSFRFPPTKPSKKVVEEFFPVNIQGWFFSKQVYVMLHMASGYNRLHVILSHFTGFTLVEKLDLDLMPELYYSGSGSVSAYPRIQFRIRILYDDIYMNKVYTVECRVVLNIFRTSYMSYVLTVLLFSGLGSGAGTGDRRPLPPAQGVGLGPPALRPHPRPPTTQHRSHHRPHTGPGPAGSLRFWPSAHAGRVHLHAQHPVQQSGGLRLPGHGFPAAGVLGQ